MTPKATFLPSFSALASKYDAFILDLWGVIHDGQKAYPGVKECLEELLKAGKKIILLSNAPRRAAAVQQVMDKMGLTSDFYHKIITSGETAYECLAHPQHSFFMPRGKRYFYIGLEKDRGILSGLDYQEVKRPSEAEFLLLSHPYTDNQPLDELVPLLKEAAEHKLPALCINPDTEVVRQTGERVYCAGLLAEEYRGMGGEVYYFGKPHKAVYEACFAEFAGIPKSRILAVGDNMLTDIKGAESSLLDSALVTGGILRTAVGASGENAYENKCTTLFLREGSTPTYVLPVFNW